VRVWDLSAHDNTTNVGSNEADQQHQHIVKEIVVFPDGSKALSCSYDKTAKVWCLRTGRCIVTLKGHGSSVNECCVFPDGDKVLTASKDGTLKVWGWEAVTKTEEGLPLGDCQLTLGRDQHNTSGKPDEIRGCGIFDEGQKVRRQYALLASAHRCTFGCVSSYSLCACL
jgi:WD40 repeat protein